MSTFEEKLINRCLREEFRFDAGESAFLTRELIYMKAKTYDIEYAPRMFEKLLPISSETPEWAETVNYGQYDRVGYAKVGSDYASDSPRVDVLLREFTGKVVPILDSFGYSIQELRAAAGAKRPLSTLKSTAAREFIEDQHDRIAALGDAQSGLFGMANNASVGITTAITGTWATATGDQMHADVNKLLADMFVDTKQLYQATALAMSPADYFSITQKPFSTTTDLTVLERIQRSNPAIVDIQPWNQLTTAGAGGVKRIIAYVKSPSVLEYDAPIRFNQLEAQKRNYEMVINCEARSGGVRMYRPRAVRYMDITT